MSEQLQEFTETELKARNALVKALWTVANKERQFGNPGKRHEAYIAEKMEFVQQASQIFRQLKAQNATIVGLNDEDC